MRFLLREKSLSVKVVLCTKLFNEFPDEATSDCWKPGSIDSLLEKNPHDRYNCPATRQQTTLCSVRKRSQIGIDQLVRFRAKLTLPVQCAN